MREWSELWKDILTSGKEERHSFVALVLVVVVVYLLGYGVQQYRYQQPQHFQIVLVYADTTYHERHKVSKKHPSFTSKEHQQQTTEKKNEAKNRATYSLQTSKTVTVYLNELKLTDLPVKGWHLPHVLQKRIIAYRNLLGGYHRIEQLQEVYGIKYPLCFKQGLHYDLRGTLTCVDINRQSFKSLLRHPYFEKEDVQTIFTHRKRVGEIHSVRELQQILNADTLQIQRIEPYLCLESVHEVVGEDFE